MADRVAAAGVCAGCAGRATVCTCAAVFTAAPSCAAVWGRAGAWRAVQLPTEPGQHRRPLCPWLLPGGRHAIIPAVSSPSTTAGPTHRQVQHGIELGQQRGVRHRHQAGQAPHRAAPRDQARKDEPGLLGVHAWRWGGQGSRQLRSCECGHEPAQARTAGNGARTQAAPASGSSSSTAPTRPLSAAYAQRASPSRMRCPPDRLVPFSATSCASPRSNRATSSLKPAACTAAARRTLSSGSPNRILACGRGAEESAQQALLGPRRRSQSCLQRDCTQSWQSRRTSRAAALHLDGVLKDDGRLRRVGDWSASQRRRLACRALAAVQLCIAQVGNGSGQRAAQQAGHAARAASVATSSSPTHAPLQSPQLARPALTSQQAEQQRALPAAHATVHCNQLAWLHVQLRHAHRGRLCLRPPHLKAPQREGGGGGRGVLFGLSACASLLITGRG